MTIQDVINENRKKAPVKWWPQYAFHYTDIENAVSILKTGWLYGRARAESLKIMDNENASRHVISITNNRVKTYARLYFRPLTPTQFHNEGYKHKNLRFEGEVFANVPVPVFFLFDLAKLIELQNVFFSETSQAGGGSEMLQGVENFKKLEFDKIYANSVMLNPQEEKKYRQAEILCRDSLDIDKCLSKIICRTEIERDTLLNLLRLRDKETYDKYFNIVSVKKDDLFEYNGIYISNIEYSLGNCNIIYSHTNEKIYYINRYSNGTLSPMVSRAIFDWSNGKNIIKQNVSEFFIRYDYPNSIMIKDLLPPEGAKELYITVEVDSHLMAYIGIHLTKAALI